MLELERVPPPLHDRRRLLAGAVVGYDDLEAGGLLLRKGVEHDIECSGPLVGRNDDARLHPSSSVLRKWETSTLTRVPRRYFSAFHSDASSFSPVERRRLRRAMCSRVPSTPRRNCRVSEIGSPPRGVAVPVGAGSTDETEMKVAKRALLPTALGTKMQPAAPIETLPEDDVAAVKSLRPDVLPRVDRGEVEETEKRSSGWRQIPRCDATGRVELITVKTCRSNAEHGAECPALELASKVG